MKVTFRTPVKLGYKNSYSAGTHTIPDHHASNLAFKKMVKAGQAVVHPKDTDTQKLQAQRDKQNSDKAKKARDLTQKLLAAKSSGASAHDVASLVAGTDVVAKIDDKRAKAGKPSFSSALTAKAGG